MNPLVKAVVWAIVGALPELVRNIRARRAARRADETRAIDDKILCNTLATAKSVREARDKAKGK